MLNWRHWCYNICFLISKLGENLKWPRLFLYALKFHSITRISTPVQMSQYIHKLEDLVMTRMKMMLKKLNMSRRTVGKDWLISLFYVLPATFWNWIWTNHLVVESACWPNPGWWKFSVVEYFGNGVISVVELAMPMCTLKM